MPLPLLIPVLISLGEFVIVWIVRSRIFIILKGIVTNPTVRVAAGAAILSAQNEIKDWLWENRKVVIAYAAGKVFGFEVEIDEEGNISEESITKAINQKYGTNFTNIFDKEAIKADLEKMGLDRINENFGTPVLTSLRDKDKLRGDLRAFVALQVEQAIDSE